MRGGKGAFDIALARLLVELRALEEQGLDTLYGAAAIEPMSCEVEQSHDGI